MQDDALQELIQLFTKLPGLGPKSATRMILFLLKNKEKLLFPLARTLERNAKLIKKCPECGNIGTKLPCDICKDPKRDKSIICVVEDIADLWALEQTGALKCRYHVLGGNLNALEEVGPDDLLIKELVDRAKEENVKEIILALSSSVNGQTTAHFIKEQLKGSNVQVTKLAQGLPFAAELDYCDSGTLTSAIKSRTPA